MQFYLDSLGSFQNSLSEKLRVRIDAIDKVLVFATVDDSRSDRSVDLSVNVFHVSKMKIYVGPTAVTVLKLMSSR